mgnify:CR=1 FL=1
MLAEKGGHSEVANELKTRGADDTIKNKNGDSKHPCRTPVVISKGSVSELPWTTWQVEGSKASLINLMIFSGMP